MQRLWAVAIGVAVFVLWVALPNPAKQATSDPLTIPHTAGRVEGIDSMKFVQIIACESSWNEKAKGDGGQSYGLPQFKRETFRWMSRLAMRDPNFVKAFRAIEKKTPLPMFRYGSHKLAVAQWGMSNGFGNHWACYGKF